MKPHRALTPEGKWWKIIFVQKVHDPRPPRYLFCRDKEVAIKAASKLFKVKWIGGHRLDDNALFFYRLG